MIARWMRQRARVRAELSTLVVRKIWSLDARERQRGTDLGPLPYICAVSMWR